MKKIHSIFTPHVHFADGSVLNKITTDNEQAALDLIAADSELDGFSHGTLSVIYTVETFPDPDIAIKEAEAATAAAAALTEKAKAAKAAADAITPPAAEKTGEV